MESVPTKVIGRATLISSLYFGQSQFFVKPMAILSDGDNGIYYSTRCNGFTFRQFNTTGVIHSTKISGKFRSKTQWIGSVRPEKFRKNWATF